MKKLLIGLIVVAVVLLGSFGDSDTGLQAKNKWKPHKIEFQDCALFGFSYYTPVEAAMATLPEGYTLPPRPPGFPEGVAMITVDMTQCENIRIGDEWDVGGGTLYHEILAGGAITDEGAFVSWAFPGTHTNPLAREALQKVGMPCRPARDLWIEVNLTEGAVALTDNLKPFGADLFASVDGPAVRIDTWPEGASGHQQHAWGNGVTNLTWTPLADIAIYEIDGAVEVEYEGEFVLPVIDFLPSSGWTWDPESDLVLAAVE